MKPIGRFAEREIEEDRAQQCKNSPVHRHIAIASPRAVRGAAAAAQPGKVAGPPNLKRAGPWAGQATTTASVAVPPAASPPPATVPHCARDPTTPYPTPAPALIPPPPLNPP